MVVEAGRAPIYGEFKDPSPVPGKSIIRVTASAISPLAKSRASGRHYSSDGELPFIPGIDGVGVAEDGRRVYFVMPEKPYGGMAEYCIVDEKHLIALPEGLADVSAAAMAIPGMSSWAALLERARLKSGETVLINGATGTSGRLAIQIAKHLGAKKIVATGRRTETFDELRSLGADVTIPLDLEPAALASAFEDQFEKGVDVVLDYLWGASAEALLVSAAKSGPEGTPIRFVQIGSVAGANISLPSAALRSSALLLMGSGIGSVPFPKILEAIQGVLEAATSAGFKVANQPMPLADLSDAWAIKEADPRIVLIP